MPQVFACACRCGAVSESGAVSVRTTLLGVGGLIWLGALVCILRTRRTGGDELRTALKQALLFALLGMPFVVAGAFYTSSSYPGYVLPPATPVPAALTAAPAATPAPRTTPPPDYAAANLAAQRAAMARYPALGVAASPFNRTFLAAVQRLKRTDPDYFADPQWPLRLADEVAGELAE